MRKLQFLAVKPAMILLINLLFIQACLPFSELTETNETSSSQPTITSTMISNTKTPLPSATSTPEQPVEVEAASATVTASPLPTLTPTSIPPTPTRIAHTEPPNIILIIVDALRADHVSSYGYFRETTPNLDRLMAQEGMLFTDVTSSAPWTCPSNASMMTGRLPSAIGVNWLTMSNSIPRRENTLAELLREEGYYTAGFVNTYCLKAKLGFSQGFDVYDDTLSNHLTSDKARAELVNDKVKAWFDRHGQQIVDSDEPLFLFMYYFDPHGWYDPLPPYDTLFDSGYDGVLTPDIYRDGQVVVSGEIEPSKRDLEHLLAMYDSEIAYWDFYLDEMFAFLEANGVFENALIVITADHGELFGEHNTWAHGSNLYEEVLRVPLLFRYTGVIYGNQVITAPVQSMDLMPTILDFAGVSRPSNLNAISLYPLLLNGETAENRSVFSEVAALNDRNSVLYWTSPRVALRSVRRDGWKLIQHGNQPLNDELYFLNLKSPYEETNEINSNQEKAIELRAILQ